jgi:hypothetical protein
VIKIFEGGARELWDKINSSTTHLYLIPFILPSPTFTCECR